MLELNMIKNMWCPSSFNSRSRHLVRFLACVSVCVCVRVCEACAPTHVCL